MICAGGLVVNFTAPAIVTPCTLNKTEADYALWRQRLARAPTGRNPGARDPHLRPAPPLLGLPHRADSLPPLPAPRAGRRRQQRTQRNLNGLRGSPLHVPHHRPRGNAPRGRGGVRAGPGRRVRQRPVRPLSRRRVHRGTRQPEPGRRRQAGAGGPPGGQSQPFPRHPPLGNLGPAPRGREHRRPPQRQPDVQRQLPRRRPRPRRHGPHAWKAGCTSRRCSSWPTSPRPCPT